MKDYRNTIELEDKKYTLVFNLNVMEKIQEKYGTLEKWGELTDGTKREVNVSALIDGLTEMFNEAIDIENEKLEEKQPFFTRKQVGRIATAVGIQETAEQLNKTIIESTKNTEKNA